MNVTGTASVTDLGAISSGKMLQLTAAATNASITAMNNTGTGIFQNAANITATITTLTGNAGTINQSGASGTIAFTNAAVNTGTITSATGTINFNTNLSGTGTITLSGNGNMFFGGSVAQTIYNLNKGTVTYNSATAQSVVATPYNNLTIANATDTTIANYKTANAVLTVTGNLVINMGNTLDMQGFITSSFGAGSSNLGKIKWSASNAYVGGSGVTEFYGSTGGNVAAGTSYGNMLFSGTGMMTFATAGTTTVTGNVTLNTGSQVTINNSVILQVNGSTFVSGNITNNGTVNVGP
jgi:hypothetical protein